MCFKNVTADEQDLIVAMLHKQSQNAMGLCRTMKRLNETRAAIDAEFKAAQLEKLADKIDA